MSARILIESREGERIVVLVDHAEPSRGVAFVAHGLGGTKEQPHISLFAQAFATAGYTAVRWDARNTFGESEGQYEDATTTNYLEDMEDVIAWARTQPWFVQPFFLCGHSLGGFCSLIYAERHPERVGGLAPIAPCVSGELSMQVKVNHFGKEQMDAWKRAGWIERIGANGKQKRIRWAELEDRMQYDTLHAAHRLRMPKLLAVGENDTSTPLWTLEKLFAALPEPKELHVIPGAPHTYTAPHELEAIRVILARWLAQHWPS